MGTVDEQLQALAQPGLAPGEQSVASLRVAYSGTTAPNTFTIETGLSALGGAPESTPDPDKLVTFPVANQMALLLTTQRLLVWSTGMRGKPKAHIGAVPLRGIDEVRGADGRLGAHLDVLMKSGATVSLEANRGEDVAGFVDAISGQLGAATA